MIITGSILHSALEKYKHSQSLYNHKKKCNFIENDDEIIDTNVVKVQVDQDLENDSFLDAKDFFRTKKNLKNEKIYHHIGIYAYNCCINKV